MAVVKYIVREEEELTAEQVASLGLTSATYAETATFTSGAVVNAGGLTVSSGGVSVAKGGLTVTSGGITVTSGGITNSATISAGDSSTKVPTTAWVKDAISAAIAAI